jgi:hypothetical protein
MSLARSATHSGSNVINCDNDTSPEGFNDNRIDYSFDIFCPQVNEFSPEGFNDNRIDHSFDVFCPQGINIKRI